MLILDPQPRFRAAALILGALVVFGCPLAGQTPPASPAPSKAAAPASTSTSAADRKAIHDALAAKYEVLPVHDGVVLKPRVEEGAIRAIEVVGQTIAINGNRVPDGVLRQWVGADAEWIQRLHRLPAAERQSLFGLTAAVPAAPVAPKGEQEIPDTGAATSAAAETPEPADSDKSADSTVAASTDKSEEGAETPEPPAAPEPPMSPDAGGRVRLFGGITVDKNESAEQAVAILGSVRVEGEVAQNAVAVGGSVEIDGKVGGNVVAVGGSVHLGPHAEVMGDVTSVGGNIYREEGSKVHGSTQDVGVAGGRHWDRDIDIDGGLFPLFRAMDLFWRLISLVVLSLLVFLCLLAARGPVRRAEYHVIHEPWKAGVAGFLAQLLFLPLLVVVTVLLAITIVGCALFLLYPFLFVGLWIVALIGYTAVVYQIGRFLEDRFHRRFGSPYAVALMGVVVVEIWSILGHMVGLGGGFLRLIALVIVAFGFAMRYAAWTVGLGAMILARLNRTPDD
ncbi:MAG TPA: hypothetical protein VH988_05865, partial [Thermoanaerobaculia bacterium]|nr:hypothetical protein [Thermoanaerobaculia bacterium]